MVDIEIFFRSSLYILFCDRANFFHACIDRVHITYRDCCDAEHTGLAVNGKICCYHLLDKLISRLFQFFVRDALGLDFLELLGQGLRYPVIVL